jgi:hypothetical protein
LGPFVGGKLSDPMMVGWFTSYTPFIFASLLCFLNVLLILWFLPETLVVNTISVDLARPFNNIFRAFNDKELRNIIPAMFLFNAGFTFFTTFWGVILASKFFYNQSLIKKNVTIKHLERGWIEEKYATRRLDKAIWPKTDYLAQEYIDCHLPRPYNSNKGICDNLFDKLNLK